MCWSLFFSCLPNIRRKQWEFVRENLFGVVATIGIWACMARRLRSWRTHWMVQLGGLWWTNRFLLETAMWGFHYMRVPPFIIHFRFGISQPKPSSELGGTPWQAGNHHVVRWFTNENLVIFVHRFLEMITRKYWGSRRHPATQSLLMAMSCSWSLIISHPGNMMG